jgi:hypothetical protein
MLPFIAAVFLCEVTSSYPVNTPCRNLIICNLLNDFMAQTVEHHGMQVNLAIALGVWTPQTQYTQNQVAAMLNVGVLEDLNTKIRYFINKCAVSRAKEDDKYIKNVLLSCAFFHQIGICPNWIDDLLWNYYEATYTIETNFVHT